MAKTLGFILLMLLLAVMFVAPVRNYMNNLFKDKSESKEEQIIGVFPGYNPRVKEIQKILKEVGFDPGSVDGIIGSQTRTALRVFQRQNSLKPTGWIDSETQFALNREEVKKPSLQSIEIDNSLGRDVLTVEDTRPDKETPGVRLSSKDRLRLAQEKLKEAGFYKSRVDGRAGPKTRRAIKAFQISKGLKPDGVLGPKTWAELNKF